MSANSYRLRPVGRKKGTSQLNSRKSVTNCKMGRPKKSLERSPSLSSDHTVSSKEMLSGKQKHFRSLKEKSRKSAESYHEQLKTALEANNIQAERIKAMTDEILSLKRFVNASTNKPDDSEIMSMETDAEISITAIRTNLKRNKDDTTNPTTRNTFETPVIVHQPMSTVISTDTAEPVTIENKKRKLSQPCSSVQSKQPEIFDRQQSSVTNVIPNTPDMHQHPADKNSATFKLKKTSTSTLANSSASTPIQSPTQVNYPKQQNANLQSQSASNTTTSVKLPRPPPIKVSELNVKAATEILEQSLGHTNFSFHRASPTDTFIRTTCKADHKAVLEVLRNSDINGHSFTPKDEKKTSILLRNVCSSYNAEDISIGIADYGLDVKVSGIDPFATEHSNRSNRNLNIWRVTLEPGSDVNALLAQKFINQLSGIRYERMRSNGITQCHNCQQFGHVASNCFRDFRCVKCHLTHAQGKCPTDILTDETTTRPTPGCVNCGKIGHPANFRGCEVHQTLIKRLNAKKAEQRKAQADRQASYNNFRQSNTSYADVMGPRPTKSNAQQRTNHLISPNGSPGLGLDIQAECHAQFGMDFRSIRQRLSEFAPFYRNAEDKGIALIQFIASIHPDFQ